METQLAHKASRLFPSSFGSCRFRTIPDVIESSIITTKNDHHSAPLSPNLSPAKSQRYQTTPKKDIHIKKSRLGSEKEARKSPHVKQVSNPNSKGREKQGGESLRMVKKSFSSNGGWFSSEEVSGETDTFFSLSSNSTSGGSFRPKTSEGRRKSWNSKSSEMGPCAFEVPLSSADKSSRFESFRWKTAETRRETMKYGRETGTEDYPFVIERKFQFQSNSEAPKSRRRRGNFNPSDNSTGFGSFHRKTAENCRKTRMGDEAFFIERKTLRSTESLNSSIDSCSDHESRHRKTTSSKTRKSSWKSEVGLSQFFAECSKTLENSVDFYYSDVSSTHRETTNFRRKTGKSRRGRNVEQSLEVPKRLEESYAVEKISNDPHNDFRTSMVEMIVEEQMFGDEDLGRLLQCFISLNSSCHHKVIFQVFLEVCEALFTHN